MVVKMSTLASSTTLIGVFVVDSTMVDQFIKYIVLVVIEQAKTFWDFRCEQFVLATDE